MSKLSDFLPGARTGDIVTTARTLSAPIWLPCDGSVYLQSTYQRLFDELGLLPSSSWNVSAVPGISGQVRAIVIGNGLWVAVGDNGRLLTSTDGAVWSTRVSGFDTTSILCVTYGGGLFVAGGGDGKLATSPDGITWTQRTSGFGADVIRSIAHNGSLFVAVGDGGKLFTSTNGTSWTQRTSSFGSIETIMEVVYANGLWVAVGASGKIVTSTNGTSWTLRADGIVPNQFRGVAYGDGLWVAVTLSGQIATSTNGTSWEAQPTLAGAGEAFIVQGLAYGGGMFMVGANGGKVAISKNGVRWTSLILPSNITDNFMKPLFHDGEWYLPGTNRLVKPAYSYDTNTMFVVPNVQAGASNGGLSVYIKT